MSKITTFQELRHECAKKYSPKDWTTNLWADFFGDCMKLHVLIGAEFDESVLQLTDIYNCSKDLINDTVAFQRDNGILDD